MFCAYSLHLKFRFNTYSLASRPAFREQLLRWMQRFPHFAFYSSNRNEADRYGEYETIAFCGNRDELRLSGPNTWNALGDALAKVPSWRYALISYETKDLIEKLHSSGPDRFRWPALSLIVPELIFIAGKKSVRIGVHQAAEKKISAADLLREISGTPPGPARSAGPLVVRQRVNRNTYLAQVRKIKAHIAKGDVYEMNYCMEFFSRSAPVDPLPLYLQLNPLSASPFSAFCRFGDNYVISSSPERYLKRKGTRLISQPIKGTARRGGSAGEDRQIKRALQNSAKERAENVMIVDLVRNDLSRIALPGSVKVDELQRIYTFRQVHQMISTVSCRIPSKTAFTDILRATFPMGSMTGAPKVRAMELIERYERSRRGLYSGAIGYLKPNGDFDLSVVIRTILYNSRTRYLSFMTGSAITAASDPEQEYEECLLKAKALKQALGAL
jgi:para-aminobenzoate synthetase component 1